MLADAGGDDGLTARQAIDFLDHVVGLNERTIAIVVHGMFDAQLVAMPMPRRPIPPKARFLAIVEQSEQRIGHQSHMTPIHPLDLVDLGGIDVEVRDEFGAAGKFVHVARHPIIKTRAHREQTIAIIDGVVGESRPVHAEHAHR